jgi:hypothetical protein
MQTFEITSLENTSSIKDQQLLRFRRRNDYSSQQWPWESWMSLLLQPILRGPRRRRMGLLRRLLNLGIYTVQMQKKEPLRVRDALQNSRKLFDVVETTCQIFRACSFYSLLQYFVNLFIYILVLNSLLFWTLSFLCRGIAWIYITV